MFLHCLKMSVSDGFGIFFPSDNSHMDTACPDLVHRASLILPFLLYILKLLLGLTFSFLLNGWSWNSFLSGFPVHHVLSEAQPSPPAFTSSPQCAVLSISSFLLLLSTVGVCRLHVIVSNLCLFYHHHHHHHPHHLGPVSDDGSAVSHNHNIFFGGVSGMVYSSAL